MGVTNYDNLPQNIVRTRLQEARQVLNERKGSPQRVAGASVSYFRVGDSSTFDWSGQIDAVSQQDNTKGIARFTITLTSQVAPVFLNDLAMEVFTSTDGVSWNRYTTRDYLNSVSPVMNYQLTRAAPVGFTPYRSRWFAAFGANLNAYMAFKLQGLASDQVSISVVRNV